MKKLALLVLVLFTLASCKNRGQSGMTTNSVVTKTIDGCEYVTYSRYGSETGYGFMAHKGNCKQCRKWMETKLQDMVVKMEMNQDD